MGIFSGKRPVIEAPAASSSEALRIIRRKFRNFYNVLEANTLSLRIISDMKEKSHGDFLFDMNYIRKSLDELQMSIDNIIENMIALGGEEYSGLRRANSAINAEIEEFLTGHHSIPEDSFTHGFSKLTEEKIFGVGGKNARLGELKTRLGMPVPSGFAITTWAYKFFVDENKLQERISQEINSVNIRNYEDLERISKAIRKMFAKSPVPEILENSIREKTAKLMENSKLKLVSVRSSAIGEDAQMSFAGQYDTYLCVPEQDVIDRYRDVLASKFTPKSIYYFMSHDLVESELAMSVGIVEMIDAKVSGVIYTRDPIDPESGTMMINSIYGLGKNLVDGVITPDTFTVERETGEILKINNSEKPHKMIIDPECGLMSQEIDFPDSRQLSLDRDEVQILRNMALSIEEHFGKPQDIEWSMDQNGDIFILQTRPLRVLKNAKKHSIPDISGMEMIASGGQTICPGAGAGSVRHIEKPEDLTDIPDGAVIMSDHPFPGLITVMDKASAFVTREGCPASHTATIAREYKKPYFVFPDQELQIADGREITVDATNCAIYQGNHPEFVQAMKPDFDYFQDDPLFLILENILSKMLPLNLLNPNSPDFKQENCRTYHDIIRYAHQKSMKEMFETATTIDKKDLGIELKSRIPLELMVIFIDREPDKLQKIKYIEEDKLDSLPMKSFWEGVLQEGWPFKAKRTGGKGLASVKKRPGKEQTSREFSHKSYAILGKEFMIISLKMGYHFSTVEALASDELRKNYIKMQFTEGGASVERRSRRIGIMEEILKKLGFSNSGKEDFLDATLNYKSKKDILDRLFILGRLSMLTKQLDMTLYNDAIADWYKREFIRKLEI